MDPNADLIQQMRLLTRADLDEAPVLFPVPDFRPECGRLHFVRIRRLARFWKPTEPGGRGSLEQCTQTLIAGLYELSVELNAPWMFLLAGSARQIACWVGLPASGEGTRALLRSTFPDVRFGEEAFDPSWFSRFGHALLLTGTPSRRGERSPEEHTDPVSRICRALYGGDWLYAVHAEPLPRTSVALLRNQLMADIWRLHTEKLAKTSALGDQNRLARQYLDLLEAQLKRHDQGRDLGMWTTQVVLAAADARWLGRGRGVLRGAFAGEHSIPEPVRTCPCRPGASGPSYRQVLHSGEVALLAHPPTDDFPGFEVTDWVPFGVEPPVTAQSGSAQARFGSIQDHGNPTGNELALPLGDLAKHALIVGVTGSGKTNTCFRLLEQVWNGGRGVPFLVVESAKSEYRALCQEPAFKGLKVFTVGDETTSPLRLNPFEVPPGVMVQTHIDYLKSLFSAAFVLYPPMPYVLEQSLREVYTDRGWDLARNTNGRGTWSLRRFPTLSDLVAKVPRVIDGMRYDERLTMDVKAGLVARLDQLRSGGGKGPMLDTHVSVPVEVLFGSPCVLELKQLVDDDEKAFLIGLVLMRLYEHYEGGPGKAAPARDGLRHVTLIEEAHRLLRNVSTEQGSEVAANPKGRAIEVFANILSEIRAYGEGLLIAEQVPVKLVPDALKNTNLKVVHRLVAEDDRKAVGATMNLDEAQTRYLTTLRSGEAVAYTEGMRKPVLVAVPLAAAKQTPREVTNAAVRGAEGVQAFWQQHAALRFAFPACQACTAAVPGASCARRAADRAAPAVGVAFRQLLQALWLEPEAVAAAYGGFRALALQEPAAGRDPGTAYCLFVELTDAELEQRGAYWGWSHPDVETLIALAWKLGALLEAQRASPDPAIPKQFEGFRQQFAAKMTDLHRVNYLPFAGCSVCPEPCFFRSDMARPASHPDAARLRAAILGEEGDTQRAEILAACEAAAATFPAQARRGAAICFAAQQADALGAPAEDQEAFVQSIADQLAADP